MLLSLMREISLDLAPLAAHLPGSPSEAGASDAGSRPGAADLIGR